MYILLLCTKKFLFILSVQKQLCTNKPSLFLNTLHVTSHVTCNEVTVSFNYGHMTGLKVASFCGMHDIQFLKHKKK